MFDKTKLRNDYHDAALLGDRDAAARIINELPTVLAYIAKLERDLEKANIKAEVAEQAAKDAAKPKAKPKVKAKATVKSKEKVEEVEVPEEDF